MRTPSVLKKLLGIASLLAIFWLALWISVYTSPVVVLHYSSTASAPVGYFFNEEDHVTKEYIHPGASVAFRTPHNPPADYFINVSLPFASRDDVSIRQPFSRVDIYIGADTKIIKTVIKTDFLARFGTTE